jgi:hypothetical protein
MRVLARAFRPRRTEATKIRVNVIFCNDIAGFFIFGLYKHEYEGYFRQVEYIKLFKFETPQFI